MNQEQAKAWLPFIQALADGRTLQRKYVFFERPGAAVLIDWRDIDGYAADVTHPQEWIRIKPEPKKQCCRLALFQFDDRDFGDVKPKFVYAARVVSMEYCDDAAKQSNFIRWLTDRIEYELPEGDA